MCGVMGAITGRMPVSRWLSTVWQALLSLEVGSLT